MKYFYNKFFIFLFIIPFSVGLVSAQMYSVPMFTRQSQLDSFHISYPNCEVIVGNLILKGQDITDTDSLSGIKEIKGSLVIDQTFIRSLKALNNLNVVKDFTISNNDSLQYITPFSDLKTILGDFLIENCPKLLSICIFPNLKEINSLTIKGNTSEMHTIDCFEDDLFIANYFSIIDNIGIHTVSGFNRARINEISFQNNNSLRNIFGFNSIDVDIFCGGFSWPQGGVGLAFYQNDSLQSIKGFDGFKCVSGILVSENPLLKEVDICNGAEAVGDFIFINNKSLEKLIAFNEVKRTYASRIFELSANSEINDLQIFKKIKNIEEIRLMNLKITSLNGSFGMVDSVYLDGRDGFIDISNNKYLTDISSLENLKYVLEIGIGANKNLGECSIESICRHIKAGRRAVFAVNNYPGCRSVNQVLAKCTVGTKDNFTDEISINPNPAYDYIDIELPDQWQHEQYKLVIYNQMGNIVLTQNITQSIRFDINSLVSGVYCMVLDNINQRFSQRFIKI